MKLLHLAPLTRCARGLLLTALLVLGLPLGCSSEECEGKIVDGKCTAVCKKSACLVSGSVCFQNECAAPCVTQGDCPLGQNCHGLIAEDGTQGEYCYTPEFAKNGRIGQYEDCATNEECDQARGFECVDSTCQVPCKKHSECVGIGYCKLGSTGNGGCVPSEDPPPGRYTACSTSQECDQAGGYRCVDAECRLAGCSTHDDCASVGLCQPGQLAGGGATTACVKGTTYPEGQYGTGCSGVLDEGTTCDDASGFVCLGAGPGDVDAYCTKTNCQADSDCATGYSCASVRTSRPPCADTCPGVPTGTNNCVPAANIGPGKEYSCGPITLLRNLCRKRDYCSECETDADCLGIANRVCAKGKDGVKMCTSLCNMNVSNACPWGYASACGVWDTALGVATCAHRFGSCKGTGKGCEPCGDDADCPGGLCLESSLSKERYCVDLSASCDCTGLPVQQQVYCIGGGCPQTPGGLSGVCYGGSAVASGGSPLYQKCVGAQVPGPGGAPVATCWPSN